jgi:hypothetical protein
VIPGAEYRENEQLVEDQPAYEGGIEGHAAAPKIDPGGSPTLSVTDDGRMQGDDGTFSHVRFPT